MTAVGSREVPVLKRGDWAALRAWGDMGLSGLAAANPPDPQVHVQRFVTSSLDGADIEMRWYSRADSSPGSAFVYVHGGGMIMGCLDHYDGVVSRYVAATGVPMLAPEYRLAPDYPHPAPVEDCYAALRWLLDHADELGVDRSRVGVIGDSAGGGLAAGVALLARDRAVPLACQLLVYPMLDDRNVVPDEALVPWATWTYDNNWTGWSALLNGDPGGREVHHSAAPARAASLQGAAPAHIDVGELDIFRDECIEYARRLRADGVAVGLHVFRGAPHGFDRIAPNATCTRAAMLLRLAAISSI
jgi:acetyl esterase/lipase